jgi:hypothetical protein
MNLVPASQRCDPAVLDETLRVAMRSDLRWTPRHHLDTRLGMRCITGLPSDSVAGLEGGRGLEDALAEQAGASNIEPGALPRRRGGRDHRLPA